MRGLEVVVVGGGIAGLAVAHDLLRRGASPQVLERDGLGERGGHGFLLLDRGRRALASLGFSETDLDRYGERLRGFELYAPSGELLASAPIEGTWGFRRRRFVQWLADTLPSGVVRFGAGFATVRRDGDGAEVQLDGHAWRPDVVVAAEGVRSATRAALFPDRALTEVRIFELVYSTYDPALHAQIGDRFLKIQDPDAHLAVGVVPAGDGHIIWFVQLDRARYGEQVEVEGGRRAVLQALVGGWAWPVPELLAATDLEDVHVWRTTDLDPLPALHDGNVVLVGDAAHPLLPFTSQGVNLALEDALSLVESFHDAGALAEPSPDTVGRALAHWSALRLPVIASTVAQGRALRERFLHPEQYDDHVVPLAD